MKVIAFYLPQFHTIPENDEWWGDGFTEWVNVKKATPLYKEHYQPRVPLDDNYYNLLEVAIMKWQISLAKEHGMYGWCIYHYWFDGHLLLEKPLEMLRDNPELNYPYCICWANENWTNAWVADSEPDILMQQKYGGKEEWKNHFDYLLTFFKDKNYIQVDGKPLLVIYRPEIIKNLNEMLQYWKKLAKKNGFEGLTVAYQQLSFFLDRNKDDSEFDYNIEFQPGFAQYDLKANNPNVYRKKLYQAKVFSKSLVIKLDRKFNLNIIDSIQNKKMKIIDYDEAWDTILNRSPFNQKSIPGAFVDWDNTPRKGEKGIIFEGATPEKFEKYLTKQIKNAEENYNKDMIFIFAWNEWAEGGYLEPDQKYQLQYLEAIKQALINTGNFTGK